MLAFVGKALSAVATAGLYSLVIGGAGTGLGLLLGAALRVMWGLLVFFATGHVLSLVPNSDWLRILAARLVGSACFAAGAVVGSYEGWTRGCTLCLPPDNPPL